jgi:hypothetical protein
MNLFSLVKGGFWFRILTCSLAIMIRIFMVLFSTSRQIYGWFLGLGYHHFFLLHQIMVVFTFPALILINNRVGIVLLNGLQMNDLCCRNSVV